MWAQHNLTQSRYIVKPNSTARHNMCVASCNIFHIRAHTSRLCQLNNFQYNAYQRHMSWWWNMRNANKTIMLNSIIYILSRTNGVLMMMLCTCNSKLYDPDNNEEAVYENLNAGPLPDADTSHTALYNMCRVGKVESKPNLIV